MGKYIGMALLLSAIFSFSCGNAGQKPDGSLVRIETDFGNIVVKLYDETPLHKENFLKLAGEGFYDDLLFHRVIHHFMIQGGDPNSKNAQTGQRLGAGDPGYTIQAEINPVFFHKKGALAAARQGDQVNPEKRSSGSQFYIVQGKVFTEGALDTLELQINQKKEQEIVRGVFTKYQDELNQLRQAGDQDKFSVRVAEIREEANAETGKMQAYRFSPEQRETYTTIGGYPSLDMSYTVFGEVVEGLGVLDKIAAVETDQSNRPLADLKMSVKIVK